MPAIVKVYHYNQQKYCRGFWDTSECLPSKNNPYSFWLFLCSSSVQFYDIHTLFSQLRLKLFMKRMKVCHLSRHYHRPFHTVAHHTFAGVVVKNVTFDGILTLHCQTRSRKYVIHSGINIENQHSMSVGSDIPAYSYCGTLINIPVILHLLPSTDSILLFRSLL